MHDLRSAVAEVDEADVGALLLAEGDDAPLPASQMRREQRLGVRHHGRRRRPQLQDLGLRLGDRLDRPHQLEVHRADRGDHRHVRRRDAGEVGDLPRPAHPQLADDGLGVAVDAAERERQAELVVVVGVACDRPKPRRQDGRQDVLGRGLAGRPGDGHHAGRRPAPHLGGDRPEGGDRRIDPDG